MTRRRVPWWLFTIAASFCGYFTLLIYSDFWGSESPGLKPDFVNGRMLLHDVAPDSPGMRAGLEPGDQILAVEGQPIHSRADWITARANFEVGRPRRLDIERGDKRFDVLMTLARESWGQKQRYQQLISIVSCIASLTTLLLALVIAFNRPSDSPALLGAWALADAGLSIISSPPQFGLALAWRHLPTFLGGFLWIAFLGLNLWAPVSLSFTALFPRKLFRSSWPLWLVWFAWIPGVLLPVLYFWRMVYQPGRPVLVLQNVNSSVKALGDLYLVATLLVLVVNYRRLENIGERRKLRVLVVGTVVGILGYFPIVFIDLFPQFSRTLFSTPVPLVR